MVSGGSIPPKEQINTKIMEYLTIFNFIVSSGTVCYLIYKYFPFYFEVNKTFWCGKLYSITLWMTTSGNRFTNYGSAKGLFTIPFRNYDKAEEWDQKMFKSGKHRKYSDK